MPLSVFLFHGVNECFYPTNTPSTPRPSKLVIQQEMAYIFSVLLLVWVKLVARPSGPRAESN